MNCELNNYELGLVRLIANESGSIVKYARIGNLDAVKTLIKIGVDVNTRDNTSGTSLYWACYCRHYKIVDLLIESGADPTISDSYDTTPLDIVISRGNLELVKKLIAVSDLGKYIQSLYDAACQGYLEIVEELLRAGVDPGGKKFDIAAVYETGSPQKIQCFETIKQYFPSLQDIAKRIIRKHKIAGVPTVLFVH